MNPFILIAILIAALSVTFSVQNAQNVQVSFLAWYFEGPLVVVLLLTFAAGAVATWLAALPGKVKRHREIEACRRHEQEHRQEGDGKPT